MMARLYLPSSFPRRRESRGDHSVACPWTPAFAGATKLFLVFALAALAACNSVSLPGWPKPPPTSAASASTWTRPGVDAATVESAYDDCLNVANSATQKDFDIDQDIAASRGSDLQHSEFAGASLRDAQQTSRDRDQTVLSSCMETKGFSPAK
jgi:uncharacterized protein YjbI with pentapeptide repeats